AMNVERWQILLNDVIETQGAGTPGLPDGGRADALELLERALVNRDTLHALIRHLQKQIRPGGFRFTEPWDEARTEEILAGGLADLPDSRLAELLLNPVALRLLADEIDE